MIVNKLKENTVYKNYKEMCLILEEQLKTGNSRKAQLESWSQYFQYHKDGHKFIIDKIYDNIIPNKKRNVTHIQLIENLILSYLTCNYNGGEVFISRNDLMLYLSLINDNYTYIKSKKIRMSKASDIPVDVINNFYQSTNNFIKRNIKTALDDLKDRSLIYWQDALAVCKMVDDVDKEGNKKGTNHYKNIYYNQHHEEFVKGFEKVVKTHEEIREATTEEYGFIADAKVEVMKEMGFNYQSALFSCGRAYEFFKKVNNKLFEQYDICYAYPAYKILYPKNLVNIDEYLEKLDQHFLEKTEENMEKNQLNKNTIERLRKSFKIKHKYLQDKGIIEDNYIDQNYYLIDLLINNENAGNINLHHLINEQGDSRYKKWDVSDYL